MTGTLFDTLRKFPSTTSLVLCHHPELKLLYFLITDKGETCSRVAVPEDVSITDFELALTTLLKGGAKSSAERR
jgi:hypothetical protein